MTENCIKSKESFVFYRSFYEAIEDLDDKKRLKMYDAITKFALKNEENTNLDKNCARLFTLIKPQISANNKRYEDGKKGGRPKKEKTTGFNQEKTTGFENDETSKKPNVNVNDNVNVNENENVNVNVNAIIDEIDIYNSEEIRNVFNIYKENCPDLLNIGYEKHNAAFLATIKEFLREINLDFGYFRHVCTKANRLKTIGKIKLDLKSVLNNHAGIFNDKYPYPNETNGKNEIQPNWSVC